MNGTQHGEDDSKWSGDVEDKEYQKKVRSERSRKLQPEVYFPVSVPGTGIYTFAVGINEAGGVVGDYQEGKYSLGDTSQPWYLNVR
jgi:hypothetical protein